MEARTTWRLGSGISLIVLLAATSACTREEDVADRRAGPDPERVEQVRADLDQLGEQ